MIQQTIAANRSPLRVVMSWMLLVLPLAANDWPNYCGSKTCSKYAPYSQINTINVKELAPVWIFRSGDIVDEPDWKSPIQCNPVVRDGVMFITTGYARVFALDAATGLELWRYDPYQGLTRPKVIVNRGVAYWSDGVEGGQRRVILGTPEGRLISLDARTGLPDPAFGYNGQINTRTAASRPVTDTMIYGPTSPPAIIGEFAIVGYMTGEGPDLAAPGDVRAFHVKSGAEVWKFRTVPQPGEFGNSTWQGESWRDRGGANAWTGVTVDEETGLVFCPLGSPSFDFYGGDRKGSNLFGNSLVALDARTGAYRWHFQTVHHDLWDYDLPSRPTLVTLPGNPPRKAVVQVTKTGFVFVFDRLTGQPLFPIEERPVPQSGVSGEETWPTQPFPTKPAPLSRQGMTEADVTDLSPEAHDFVLNWFRSYQSGPMFTPPSQQGTVALPGILGGGNWSGASFDPSTNTLYVNSNEMPFIHSLIESQGTPYPFSFIGYRRLNDEEGYPGVKPPWGHLTAIDLTTGDFRWRVTLGEFDELKARGIPQTGAPNLGGNIVTSGGLIFIGSTLDEKFRAFNKSNGQLLWEYKLDAGAYALPATYMVNGRQFVAIAAGGGGRFFTKVRDGFHAFALPMVGGTPKPNVTRPGMKAPLLRRIQLLRGL